MNQFQGITRPFPDSDGEEGPQEELYEELAEIAAKGGDELLGKSTIPPSFYRCSTHGKILAQDVVWGPDDLPHCPECEAELGHE